MGVSKTTWQATTALCATVAWAFAASAQQPPPPAAPATPAPIAPAAPAPAAPAPAAPELGAPAPETTAPAEPAAPEAVAPPPSDSIPPPPEEPVAGDASLAVPSDVPISDSAAEARGAGDEIVVTGSRIKRTSNFAPAAPVQVVDRKQLEFSGAQNLGDVIQYLTAAGGSDFSGRSQGGWGVSQVNLRGLGPQATLVLINGRRVVPSAIVPAGAGATAANIVDIGQLPITSIERIEVMRGGGSAVYGADAVAGVVNVITRKDYRGLRVDGSALTTEEFDHSQYSGGATLGAASERARANVSIGVTRQTNMLASDRDWTKGLAVAQIGNPATFITTSLVPPVKPDPDCELGERSFLSPQDPSMPNGSAFCSVDGRDFADLMPPTERITSLGYGEYDLTDHTMAFIETGLSSLRAQLRIPPSFPTLSEVFVPADHIDNPWGAQAQYLGTPITDAHGADAIISEEDTIRFVAGLKGDFEAAAADTVAEDWEWELYGTWGRAHLHGSVPDIITDRLQTALDSCSNPNDLSNCFNPFYSAVTGKGTPNSEEVLRSFRGNMQYFSDSWMATADGGLTGGLFELPGGDLGFAIGGQYRYEERQSDVDHDGNFDRYAFVLGNADASAQRSVGAGYLELLWPFYDGIELQTAGRLEHYEGIGTSFSPQASLVLIPAEIAGRDNVADGFRRLRFRGVITRAFRAPSLYEVFPGYTTGITQFENEGPVPAFVPVQTAGNPDLKYETSLITTGGLEWSPVKEWGFSADYWRYTYDDRIAPDDIQGHYLEDRFDPEYFDRGAPPERVLRRARTKAINTPGEVVTQGLDFGTAIKLELDEVGVTTSEAGTFSFAIDGSYVLAYDVPVASVAALELDDGTTVKPDYCDSDSCDVAGFINFANFAPPLPRLRLNVPVSWNDDHHAIALMVHFISGYEDDSLTDPVSGMIDAADPQYDYWKIDAMITLDLSYGYTFRDVIGESTTLRIGVINLLDTDPSEVHVLGGYDPATHDPRGRSYYARLTQEF